MSWLTWPCNELIGQDLTPSLSRASLRDAYPFISATKIAEARAEANRVMTYLEKQVFPIHGIGNEAGRT